MGGVLGAANGGSVNLYMNDSPTFPPNAGFKQPRKERVMIAKEEDLKSARIDIKHRDYCAHLLLDYHVCRYKHFPFTVNCHHEKHNYLNCEQADYVIRMKEFERERRLRIREERLANSNVC